MKYILLAALLCIFLSGCYTRKKAEHQVALAGATFPDILAKKARDLFPCVTKGGDTIWVSDSAEYRSVMQTIQDENVKLYIEKDSLTKAINELQSDTILDAALQMYQLALANRDKIIEKFAYQLAHPPVITNTAIIHDTTVDNAAVRACEIDKNTAISLLDKKTTESDGWHSKAKKRYYIMWGLILLIALVAGWKVYNAFKPKLKSV